MEQDFPFTLTWLDWTLLAILAVSTAWGCFRGLLRTVVSLAALFVSAFLTIRFGETAAAAWPTMPGRGGFARAALFFGSYISIRVVGSLLVRAAHSAGMRGLDLAAGGAFGALRGVAISFLLALGLSTIGFDRSPSWQRSITPPYLGAGARAIFSRFPPTREWADRISFARRAGFVSLGNYVAEDAFVERSLDLFGRRLAAWWQKESPPRRKVEPLRAAPDLREQAEAFMRKMLGGDENLTERYNTELAQVVQMMGEIAPGGSAENAQRQMRVLEGLREGEILPTEVMDVLRKEGVWEAHDARSLPFADKLRILREISAISEEEL